MSIIDRFAHIASELARQGMRLARYDESGHYVTVTGLDGVPSRVWATEMEDRS